MNTTNQYLLICVLLLACLPGCHRSVTLPEKEALPQTTPPPGTSEPCPALPKTEEIPAVQTKEQILAKFSERTPKEWGERVPGVKTRLNTDEKVIALTFDACGGKNGSGFDEPLIRYLENEQIPVTLFVSGKWIDANPKQFEILSKNPLFEIENHGLKHRPCSSDGHQAYKIAGTKSVDEIYDEIELNARKIQELTGYKPKYFRPAAAYCDDICVGIADALGMQVVQFSVLGDAGATYSKKQIREALLHAPPASIILMHMNHPEKETASGVIETIPELKKRGFKFVKLSEYDLK